MTPARPTACRDCLLLALCLCGLMILPVQAAGPICAFTEDGQAWSRSQAAATRLPIPMVYRNRAGQTIIPADEYHWDAPYVQPVCIRHQAWLWHKTRGLERVDNRGQVLYQAYMFDNGPDHPQQGRYRIRRGDLIGYADATTGRVVIEPQFQAAFPFQHGRAQVSCRARNVRDEDGHGDWADTDYFEIDRHGRRIRPNDSIK